MYLAGSIFWVAYFMFVMWPKTVDYLWAGMVSAMELHIGMRDK